MNSANRAKYTYLSFLSFISFLSFFLLISFLAAAPLSAQQSSSESEGSSTEQSEGEQSNLLRAYQRNFARGNLSTKIQILQDAGETDAEDMGKLYVQAVDFFLDNLESLSDDATAQELAKLGAQLIGQTQYREGISRLWMLFERTESIEIRVAVINAFGRLLNPEDKVLEEIETWLRIQNGKFREGREVNKQLIGEAITTLGSIGSSSSFEPIFTASVLGYSQQITERAESALDSLGGNLSELVIEVLRSGYPNEKLSALEWAMEKEEFGTEQKGRIATVALEEGLERFSSAEDSQKLRELRLSAARHLTELEWSEASSLAIKHFNQTVTEVDTGTTSPSVLLEAIALLGSIGTHEAAVRLSLYLEVLNSYVENGRRVNEQVVLAVIRNLGRLGDNVAFDHLLLVRYLDYSRRVKEAAREVLRELR